MTFRTILAAVTTLAATSTTVVAATIGGTILAPTAPYQPGVNGYVKILGGQSSTNTDGTGKLQITAKNPSNWTYNRPWLFKSSDAGVVGGIGVIAGSTVWLDSQPTAFRMTAGSTRYVTLNYRIPLDGLPHSITVYEDQAPGVVYNYNPATAVAILRYDFVAG